MAETINNTVRVEIGNSLTYETEEVQCALAGLAYIAGALISVGNNSLVTRYGMSLYETLLDKINSGLTDDAVWSKLEEAHPNMGSLVDDTEKYKSHPSFVDFLKVRGVFGNEYTLEPIDDPAQNQSFRLTFLSFG